MRRDRFLVELAGERDDLTVREFVRRRADKVGAPLALPPTIYSLVLAGIAVGMVIGGQINVLLLSRWTEHQILVFGLLLHAACCVALLIATIAMGAGVYVAGALIFLAMASLMLVVGNGIALVMKNAPISQAGAVSSLLGVLQYAFAGVSGAALALAYDATLTPFITAMLLCAVGALIAFVVATRRCVLKSRNESPRCAEAGALNCRREATALAGRSTARRATASAGRPRMSRRPDTRPANPRRRRPCWRCWTRP
jgi:MFS family permease